MVIEKLKLTEGQIQRQLFLSLFSTGCTMIPNFTPTNWWECDLCLIDKNGHMVEFEIKLTKQNFYDDFKKVKSLNKKPPVFKHQLLSDNKCPLWQYWFVIK